MKILRIYNTSTGDFIRDDFEFNPETESTYEGDIPGGLYLPRYDGETWVEGLTAEQIQALKDRAAPAEPSIEERVAGHDAQLVTIEQTIDVIYGGI